MLLYSSYFLFIVALFFAPLAFGTVELWSTAMMEWLVMAATISLLFFRLLKKDRTFYSPPGLIALLLFSLYLFLQTVPLPIALLKVISPASFALKMGSIGSIENISWGSISINRHRTLMEFYRFFSYTCLYFLTTQLLTNKKYLFRTIKVVVILGILIAVQAILQRYTADGLIYWFRSVPAKAFPIGPYIYRNHYAGFMVMICPLALGLFLVTRPSVDHLRNMRKRIVVFFNHPRNGMHLFLGAGVCLIVVSIFVSLSRGGILSLCGALLCFTLLLLHHGRIKPSKTYFWILVLVVTILMSWFGWDAIVERFYKTYTINDGIKDGRIQVWHDTLIIIKDYWLTGSGFGSYIDIYPAYRSVPGIIIYDHAHNDYLELLSSGGIISFILISAFLIPVLQRSLLAIKKRQTTYSIYMTYACFSSIVAILLHSITDFNFYNGANGLYFFFCCGLLVSISHSKLCSSGSRRSNLSLIRQPVLLPTSIILLIIIFSSGVNVNFGAIKAKHIFDRLQKINLTTTSKPDLEKLQIQALQMIKLDPVKSNYYFMAGNIELYSDNIDSAFKYLKKAARLNPANYEFIQRLGIVAASLGKSQGEKLIQRGIDLAPRSSMPYQQYSRWLIAENRYQEASKILKFSIQENKGILKESLKLMEEYSFSAEMMQKAIPEDITDQLFFCRYLEKSAKHQEAETGYERAVQILLADKLNTINQNKFEQVANYFIKNKTFNKALLILKQAKNRYPNDARIFLRLGDVYKQKGDLDKAQAAYLQALTLSPTEIDLYLRLGACLNSVNKHVAAKEIYDKAASILENKEIRQIGHYLSIANFYKTNKDLNTAFKVLQGGVQYFPDSVQMLINFGWVCQKMGKRLRGEDAFHKALKLMTQGARRAWWYRSIASYYAKEDLDKSINILQEGSSFFPRDTSLLINLAAAYIRLKKVEPAKKALQKALELSPKNKPATKLLEKINRIINNVSLGLLTSYESYSV